MSEFTLLKGGYIGDSIGEYYIGLIQGDTRSLDYGSYMRCFSILLLLPY